MLFRSGTSQSILTVDTYTADHWRAYSIGAPCTGQRVAGSGNTQYRYQITGAATVSAIKFSQRIEAANCYDLATQQCSIGVDLANSTLTNVTYALYYANTTDTFGNAGAPTRTQITSGSFTVTGTVTRYTVQGINVPAGAVTGLELEFSVGAQTSGTWIIGNVQLGAKASVWPCAVLRGDIAPIEVGEGSNIQDGAVVHVADGLPAKIGARVTVGHLEIGRAHV